MDALSDVLRTIKLSGVIFLRAELGQHYGVLMPPATLSHPLLRPPTPEHRLVMFHIVRDGAGWVELDGFAPRRLETGDLIIVLADISHAVVDEPGRPKVSSVEVVSNLKDSLAPPAAEVGAGPCTMRLVCGMLQFVERGMSPVFSALPPFLHVRRGDGPSDQWLNANIDYIISEAESGRAGSELLLGGLAQLMFVQTLRRYIEALPEGNRGWFSALKDPKVGHALLLMHQRPTHDWTVAELARRVGVSRSAFSARFSELLETSPIAYLYRWRIRLATNLLEETTEPIPVIAQHVGYESESAFHRAFKRELGVSPAAFRSSHRLS